MSGGWLLPMAIVAAAARAQESIPYSEAGGGGALTLDYYKPGPAGPLAHPAAILLHGGGLVSGSSRDEETVGLAGLLSRAGYAVFAVNYRLAPQHPYPAASDDVLRAIRFVRFHVRRWRVDPKQIALVGTDAGGYLASLAGVQAAAAQPGAADAVGRQSAAVQAVVSFFAYSDFRGWPASPALRGFLAPLIEAQGLEQALAAASPVMKIRPGAPPFLLIHGDADEVVPMVQSTHWQNALQAAGVKCNLMLIGGGGHDAGEWARLPGVRNWAEEMVTWLDAALGRLGGGYSIVKERAAKSAGQ